MFPEYQSASDEVLACQTRAGVLGAFEELVSRYERRIYAFICQFCPNVADAQEVTQDTFVKAFQAIGRFDPRHSFAAWLFTIARRKCIDHHRTARPPAEQQALEPKDTDDPAELMAQQEDKRNLWQLARRHLPASQFQALWLRYAEDMSIEQIGRVLRKTQTHVKVLLFRARRSLALQLTQPDSLGSPSLDRASLAGAVDAPFYGLQPHV